MVQEVKGENLGILYFEDFVYMMTRACKADEFSPCERMFACQLYFCTLTSLYMAQLAASTGEVSNF